ncbi:MAG: Ppx/GppA family phosphatase [Alphaproteobacteria bacterium]|nr:Ppx/GppA family phosphatase [Alphaproteobacteria bacterium]
MPDLSAAEAPRRIAVVDVGSNSLRLVVFERFGATLLPHLNEKVMCGLGRGIAATGRLNRDGVALALPNLERFVAMARALEADHLAIIATAAIREASDGPGFAAEIERRCGAPVRVIDGAEEARLSAAGVAAGIPMADGVVADLGGGSVELVRLGAAGPGTIGTGISLPLGPLRLAELGSNTKAVTEAIERSVAGATVLRAANGRTLYLVGGAWRALARLHMDSARYPLHIIHGYTIARRQAEAFLDLIGGQSRRSLERVTSVARRRLEAVPFAALILRRLISTGRPERITFSAFGLREGYANGLIPAEQREGDPLLSACIALATGEGRFGPDGEALQRWSAPLFSDRLPAGRQRLHRAVCWLSDIGWSEHPDYRAEQVFTRTLRMPFAGLSHPDRVFVASALHARYAGAVDDPVLRPVRPLLESGAAEQARILGSALRLAYAVCGGRTELLSQTELRRDPDRIVLETRSAGGVFGGEAVQRRLESLGRALGLNASLRTARREAAQPV